MRSLELDYLAVPTRGRWAQWALLIVGVVLAADVVRAYVIVKREVARAEERIAHTTRPAIPAPNAAEAKTISDELAAARGVVKRFAIPWPALFRAVEAIQLDTVTLLSIEPDPEAGTLTITGEARDYLAALTFVAQLHGERGLSEVLLTRHEVTTTDPRRPVAFTVSATWRRS